MGDAVYVADPSMDEDRADRAVARVAYWVFGLFGSAVLAFADVLTQAGSLRYADVDLEGPLSALAFAGVMMCALLGVAGVVIAGSRPLAGVWLLRISGAGALVASIYALAHTELGAGAGLLVMSVLPLFAASLFVSWAERPA